MQDLQVRRSRRRACRIGPVPHRRRAPGCVQVTVQSLIDAERTGARMAFDDDALVIHDCPRWPDSLSQALRARHPRIDVDIQA